MVRLERIGLELRAIRDTLLLVTTKSDMVISFFNHFDFPAVDVYGGTFSECQDFIVERGYQLALTEGLRVSKVASLHYIKNGSQYVGYLADELGQSKVLIKSDNLQPIGG